MTQEKPGVSGRPLYGGLSGAKMEMERFDLGHEVVLSSTYAHIMAPYIMAFAPPAQPGTPHPTPWRHASGGYAFDIHIQAHIPSSFQLENWFDNLNTVWWIAALLRLRVSPMINVPVLSNQPFSEAAHSEVEPTFWPVEMRPDAIVADVERDIIVGAEDLDWLKQNWIRAGNLDTVSVPFNRAVRAFDRARKAGSPGQAIILLWGGLEQLFSRNAAELQFRACSTIASFLEPAGIRRLETFERLKRLYKVRSGAAHGGSPDESDAFAETYEVLRRSIFRFIEIGTVPTVKDLERNIFDNHMW